ncbi:MAG: polysaccharide biosynthesis tyrosine autokinase [Ignavibacteriales bacterium]|nr:polysaccharide biosynthesis tyrosine autokinase [Ignavibacteriales bacterium]
MNNGKGEFKRSSTNRLSSELSFQEDIYVILRGRWMILTIFLLVMAGTAFYTFTMDPVYESTVAVLVDTKGQQSQLPLFEGAGGSTVKNIKNEVEILRSRLLTEAVARRLLQKGYVDAVKRERIPIVQPSVDEQWSDSSRAVAQIARRLAGQVEFEIIRDSDVIKITAKSSQPREAALLANTYAETYYERNLFASRTRSRSAREFLDGQLKTRKTALDESESNLQNYMEQKGMVSLDGEANKVIDQLSQLEAQRDAADISLQSLKKTLSSYQEQLATQEPNVAKAIGEANDPYIRMLQEQLAKLEVQRDITISKNPVTATQGIYAQDLREIEIQIGALRENLKKRTGEFLQSLLPGQRTTGQSSDPLGFLSEAKRKIIETQIEIQSLQARKDNLQNIIAQYELQFESIPQKNIQFARLQRARLSNEKLYLLVEGKFNETAIKEKSEFGYIDIIDPAIVPSAPVSPKVRLYLALGALLGLGLGIAMVFLWEYIDERVRTPEELKKQGYSTLTTVELMNGEIKRMGGKKRILRDGRLIDAHLLSFINSLSPIAESYRRLRTGIQYVKADRPIQTILVTSPNPSEGKSTTVSNLAIIFAQMGKKVILLDTDLRKPSLHSKFGLERNPGLSELLFENAALEDVLRKTPIKGLEIICRGTVSPHLPEALGTQKMKDFIEQLKKQYDIILFDSPPVLAVTDSLVLSTLVDGVVVVVSSGNTRMDTLERGLELVENVGARFLGVVLNNFDLRLAYGGYYGYRRHYHYGYGYSLGKKERKGKKKVKSRT